MADLRDGLLRALKAHFEGGNGLALAVHDWQCCIGAHEEGLTGCTCWRPVFDLVQNGPEPATIAAVAAGRYPLAPRDGMCGDCAYRPDSPEKSGDPNYHSAADLESCARQGRLFFCHHSNDDGVGMRQPIAWQHPDGIRIPAVLAGDYQPPIIDGVPYLADGSPAPLCAGWAARARALAHRDAKDADAGRPDALEVTR